jgi:hypothetical protein
VLGGDPLRDDHPPRVHDELGHLLVVDGREAGDDPV